MLASAAAQILDILSVPPGGPAWAAINDPERATPTGSLLKTLRALRPDIRWTVAVACGTHRHPQPIRDAHEAAHDLHTFCADRILWHDGQTPQTALPTAPPLHVPVLAIGSVEPHWFAGWTGAHKTLTVGLWDRDRIEHNHAHAMSPAADVCRLDSNPVYEGFVSALTPWMAQRTAPLAAANFVFSDNTLHSIHIAPCALTALQDAIPSARSHFVKTIPAPLDRLLARVDGPLGVSLYQAMKAIKNNASALRDGAALILSAPCPHGVGISHFTKLLAAHPTWAAADAFVRTQGYRLGDHKAVRLLYLTDIRHLQLAVVSPGLSAADAALCKMQPFPSEAEALAWAASVAPGPHALTLDDAANQVRLTP